jgi:hypothetical protein
MQQKVYWLDYDAVALAVLAVGLGTIGLLTLSISLLVKTGNGPRRFYRQVTTGAGNPATHSPWVAGFSFGPSPHCEFGGRRIIRASAH